MQRENPIFDIHKGLFLFFLVVVTVGDFWWFSKDKCVKFVRLN